jgi:hypothetical protein
MNTIEIVEEWSQFQDEGSIDWSDMPINQSVEYNDERVGLRAEFQQPNSFRDSTEGRRFGFASYGTDLDDDPE